MTQSFKIPWGAWYLNPEEFSLEFPDSWEISNLKMNDASPISDKDIERSLNNPIGTPSLEELASGKKDAVIVIDDISRPTRADKILEIILEKLNASGIPDEKITIIFALGGHRPMIRDDFIKKIGLGALERLNVENHHPYENLEYIGESKLGTPIYINKTYNDAELKIAIGCVVPHPLPGYGGGGKIILPGVCGIETLEANHQAALRGVGVGLGFVTELRKDIEDVCGQVGLDFSINTITTMNRGIAGIFAGDFIEAHRKAMDLAKEVYSTELPEKTKFDVGFFNSYPEDTELYQSHKALNMTLLIHKYFKRKSAIITMSAATEGRGFHSLMSETGSRLYKNWGESVLWTAAVGRRIFGVFSPNVTRLDVNHLYPSSSLFHKDFSEMIKELEGIYGESPKACIIPTSIQLPK